jgi:hypothetical protein
MAVVQGEGKVKTLEGRLEKLEKLAVAYGLSRESIPGTSLIRSLLPNAALGMGWCLSIGGAHMPKLHFYESTISKVLEEADKYFATIK